MSDLETLARAATPGPWRQEPTEPWMVTAANEEGEAWTVCRCTPPSRPNGDAAYIAAASPDVILALLALARESSLNYHRAVHDRQTLLWDCPDPVCVAARGVLGTVTE